MESRPKIAKRMESIQPFYVMELLTRARELESNGRSIIHMEVGEPDFDTPEPILRAGRQALEDGFTKYLPATGLPELRKVIADFYMARYGVPIDPECIIVTPGSSGALQLALSVLIDPGEKVLMADPGYPCNRHFVSLVSGEPVTVPVGADSNYQLSASMVDAAWESRTQAVMVASPSNPTGTLLSHDELKRIHGVVSARGGTLIVDEIYQGLVYAGDGATALEIPDDLFVINSFSKYFGMTGWRLGWMVVPEAYTRTIERLAQNIFISSSSLAQYAALVAFEPDTISILEARRQEFKNRRDFLLPALRKLGFKIAGTPQGAFYLYADCSTFRDDSFEFCRDLLEQEGVAVTPGKDFGTHHPERHLRFAYTTSIPRLKEGMVRLARFVGKASN